MSPITVKLFDDALRLPPRERADLAESLINSLETDQDQESEAAWDALIARRVKELKEGSVETVSWEELRQELRASLNEPTGA